MKELFCESFVRTGGSAAVCVLALWSVESLIYYTEPNVHHSQVLSGGR